MRKALLVLLVVVVLLTGAPVLMGGTAGDAGVADGAGAMSVECAECGPAVLACTPMCAALLALGVAAALAVLGAVPRSVPHRRLELLTTSVFHPPRLA